MVPVLRGFVLGHETAIAFFAAYGELAIGLALVFGVLVRVATGRRPYLPYLHVHAAVRGQLSGPRHAAMAVLQRLTGTSGPRDVLRDFCASR
jgi:hypothetical protein